MLTGNASYPLADTHVGDPANRGSNASGGLVDVEVVIWGLNVLPSEPSGSYDPIAYNDAHKYEFARFLQGSGRVRGVTIVYPVLSNNASTLTQPDPIPTSRIRVPASSLALAALWFNIRLAWLELRSDWHVGYFYDDGKAIPFVLPLLLMTIRGFPAVLDYRNPPVVHSLAQGRSPRRLLSFLAEAVANKAARLVVVLSPECANIVGKSFGGSPLVVPSQASPLFIREPNLVRGPKGTIRFAYWGALNKSRKLEDVLSGFAEACRNDPRISRELILIGEGDDKSRLESLAESDGMSNVRFFPWCAQRDLQGILDTATVSIVPVPDTIEQFSASYPLKFVEALALGKPILASNIPAMRQVEEWGIGVVSKHDKESYARAFLAFDDESLNRFVRNLEAFDGRADTHTPRTVFAPFADWLAALEFPGSLARNRGTERE